jgi:hypothetical protein
MLILNILLRLKSNGGPVATRTPDLYRVKVAFLISIRLPAAEMTPRGSDWADYISRARKKPAVAWAGSVRGIHAGSSGHRGGRWHEAVGLPAAIWPHPPPRHPSFAIDGAGGNAQDYRDLILRHAREESQLHHLALPAIHGLQAYQRRFQHQQVGGTRFGDIQGLIQADLGNAAAALARMAPSSKSRRAVALRRYTVFVQSVGARMANILSGGWCKPPTVNSTGLLR